MAKTQKKPAKEMAGPPTTTKRKRTRKNSARVQAGSFPGYGVHGVR